MFLRHIECLFEKHGNGDDFFTFHQLQVESPNIGADNSSGIVKLPHAIMAGIKSGFFDFQCIHVEFTWEQVNIP